MQHILQYFRGFLASIKDGIKWILIHAYCTFYDFVIFPLLRRMYGVEFFSFCDREPIVMACTVFNSVTKRPVFINYYLYPNMTERNFMEAIIHEWLHYVLAKEVSFEASDKFDKVADVVVGWVVN